MQVEELTLTEEAIPPEERRKALRNVLSSSSFRRSIRLRHFLAYIIEKTIKDESVTLTEQQLGVALFDRRSSYDTSADNIVRVNATQLRKRLEQFYAGEGADESVWIEVPRGSYRPVFVRHTPQVAATVEQKTEPSQPLDPLAREDPSEVRVVEKPKGQERSRLLFTRTVPPLIVLVLLSSAVAIFQTVRVRSLEQQLEPWQSQEALRSFWENFFNTRANTTIVLADTSFAMAQDLSKYQLTLDDYLRSTYLDPANLPINSTLSPKAVRTIFLQLSGRNTGSIGDFLTALRIYSLRAPSLAPRIQFARDFSGEALRHDSSILIGSTRSNPWVEPFRDRLFYQMKQSPDGTSIQVELRDPHAGEQAAYSTSSDPHRTDGFCVIAFLPNLSSEGRTLIIAGTDSQSTEAGGDFMTHEESLQLLRKMMRTPTFGSFQVLLRTKRVIGGPLSTEPVSFRVGTPA